VAGCPADVSHGTVLVIEVEVIDSAGSKVPAQVPHALAATAVTSNSPWRDQRANDSGLRRLTQIRWDRTTLLHYCTTAGDRSVAALLRH
jgi:hypothetical protein